MKTEICFKLDEFRTYYTTLTYKETQIDELEARCIEATACDERLETWLQKLNKQIRELEHHQKTRDCEYRHD